MCVCVCLCMFMCVSLCVYLRVCVSACMRVSACGSMCRLYTDMIRQVQRAGLRDSGKAPFKSCHSTLTKVNSCALKMVNGCGPVCLARSYTGDSPCPGCLPDSD